MTTAPSLPDDLRMRADGEGPRVEHVPLGPERVWIKRASPSQRTGWHRAQGILAGFLRHPMLRVTADAGGPGSLAREAARIETFRAAGFLVPEIFHVSDRSLVLGDLGPTLGRLLRDRDPAFDEALCAAGQALGGVHAAGLVHGRPSLRDLTFDHGRIGFIDFEEAPETVMPLATAQARDLWLFAVALARADVAAPAMSGFLDAYRPSLSEERRRVLQPLVRSITRLGTFVGPLTAPFAGRDLTAPLAASRFLDRALRESVRETI